MRHPIARPETMLLALLGYLSTACGGTMERGDGVAIPSADSSAPKPASPSRCAAAPTAPLVAIESVRESEVVSGPCGDVMYAGMDGSVWHRTPDGSSRELTRNGRVGTFDWAGQFLSYLEGDTARMRSLATGDDVAVEGAYAIRFGLDPATGESLPFAETIGRGISLFKNGTFSRVEGTEPLSYLAHSNLGATLALYGGDGVLSLVNLSSSAKVVGRDVTFRDIRSQSDGTRRSDLVRVSEDGRLVFFQPVELRPCGDTFCATAGDTTLIRASSGATIRQVATMLSNRSGGPLPNPTTLLQSGTTVAGSLSRPFSIHTEKGEYAEYTGRSLLGLVSDGRVALRNTTESGPRLLLAQAGAGTEVAIAGPAGTAVEVLAVSPSGSFALYARTTGCVRVTGTDSCHGAGQTLELELWAGTERSTRWGDYSQITRALVFDDGTGLIHGVRFDGSPPAEAPMDGLRLTSATHTFSSDGALRSIEGIPTRLETATLALSDGRVAISTHSWDGKRRTQGIYTIPRGAASAVSVVETDGFVRFVNPADGLPPRALTVVATRDGASGSATLWHGQPR